MAQKKRPYYIKETGIYKKNWRGKVPVCVVFPNSYYMGMSNLAVHLLYETLNTIPHVVCERMFFEQDSEGLSVESKKPLMSFELVFFTISFELDYINIVNLLKNARINIHRNKRGEKEPIIIAGGPLIMANPEPLCSFFDLFLMGDIEAIIPKLMEDYFNIRTEKRQKIIEALSKHIWVYNPDMLSVRYNEDGTISEFIPEHFKIVIKRYNGESLAKSCIITNFTEFSRMFLIEGTRGCPSRCSFCLIGNIYPFIFDRTTYLPENIKDIGLIGGGISFHPYLEEILRTYIKNNVSVHFPSLRIDTIPVSIIETLKDHLKTLTFGIETGNESLRMSIGKAIKDDDIFEKIQAIMDIKSFNLKFYFMIGLPNETKKDIESIVELTKKIRHIVIKKGAEKRAVGNITVHISPFVPKPATPFQRKGMENVDSLKEKLSFLKHAFARMDNVFFTHESVKFSFLQAVLARGDRRVSDIIQRLSNNEGLFKIIKESPINLNFYALRERDEKETLPWDFIFIP